MLFMGEEFGATTPFLFFCDFEGDLAQAVTDGRRNEFARFARFRDPAVRERIPDPNAPATFAASKLDWKGARAAPGVQWRTFYRDCLSIRHRHVMPLARDMRRGGTFAIEGDAAIRVCWRTESGARLHLVANFSEAPVTMMLPDGRTIFAEGSMPAAGTTGIVACNGVAFIVADATEEEGA